MKRLLSAVLFVALAFSVVAPASAQVYSNSGRATADRLCSTVGRGAVPCVQPGYDTPFAYDAGSTKTLTQFIAAPTSGAIHIPPGAGFVYGEESATGGTLEIEQGTGSNCASNAAVIYAVAIPATGEVAYALPALQAKAGYALCFFVSAGTLTDGGVFGTASIF